jgi:hypothetical protein
MECESHLKRAIPGTLAFQILCDCSLENTIFSKGVSMGILRKIELGGERAPLMMRLLAMGRSMNCISFVGPQIAVVSNSVIFSTT